MSPSIIYDYVVRVRRPLMLYSAITAREQRDIIRRGRLIRVFAVIKLVVMVGYIKWLLLYI